MHRTARRRSSHVLVGVACALALLAAACAGSDDVAEVGEQTDAVVQEAVLEACEVPTRPVPRATPVPGSPSDLDVESFDGTPIRLHWFPRDGADASAPSPTVMMGPGWSLPGDTDIDSVGVLGVVSIASLHDAGYNVATWDPRGFGASGGTAMVDAADFEGRDVQTMIDWLATQPEVELDGARDPRMGMVGGSYGGGIQLIVAAMDCRVDAIVPIAAWSSLESSLFRNETVKIGWAGVLHDASISASVDEHVNHAYESGRSSGTLSPGDVEWFIERGPGDAVAQISVPTLLIQGTVDTLFTLDEALENYSVLREQGVPAALMAFCGGHGICLTDPGDPGAVSARTIAWLDRWVKGDASVDTGATIDLLDQLGARHVGETISDDGAEPWRAEGSGTLALDAAGGAGPVVVPPEQAGVLSFLADRITPAPASNAVEVDVETAQRPAPLLAGAPTLTLEYRGTVEPGERPTRVFAQLVDGHTGLVIGNQITPVPVVLDGEAHRVEVPLESIVFAADAESSLILQLVANTVAYSSPRLGGQVEFERVALELPVVDSLRAAP